ncbi:hypothetical protein Tco_0364902 [Tanacetum coccineum]
MTISGSKAATSSCTCEFYGRQMRKFKKGHDGHKNQKVGDDGTSVDHPSNNYSYYADTGVDDHHIKAAQKRVCTQSTPRRGKRGQPIVDKGHNHPSRRRRSVTTWLIDIDINNSFGCLKKLIVKMNVEGAVVQDDNLQETEYGIRLIRN